MIFSVKNISSEKAPQDANYCNYSILELFDMIVIMNFDSSPSVGGWWGGGLLRPILVLSLSQAE